MKPTGKRVLVEVVAKKQEEVKLNSGIILTARAQEEPLVLKGRVLSVGSAVEDVFFDDTAIFMPYSGVKVGEGLFILTEDEILATE